MRQRHAPAAADVRSNLVHLFLPEICRRHLWRGMPAGRRRRRGLQLRLRLRSGPAYPPPGCFAHDQRHPGRRVRRVRADDAATGRFARLHRTGGVRAEAGLHGAAGAGRAPEAGAVAGAERAAGGADQAGGAEGGVVRQQPVGEHAGRGRRARGPGRGTRSEADCDRWE